MKSAAYIAAHIRQVLKNGGSAPHSEDVQRFFTEYVPNHGWRTADQRKLARRFSRALLEEGGPERIVAIADKLFTGRNSTEKTMAVLMLENHVGKLGAKEFKLFESWLDRITNWGDHDGLVHYLIAPMMMADPTRAKCVFRWAKSKNFWLRRAAAVALIQGTRRHMFFDEIVRVSEMLLDDKADMVQKGLGWLLRETAKADPKKTVPYLMKIRERVPRLVLRTACETLPLETRKRILSD